MDGRKVKKGVGEAWECLVQSGERIGRVVEGLET
jgi:hypothetical protein